jgi:hypothetical protein
MDQQVNISSELNLKIKAGKIDINDLVKIKSYIY